MSKAMVSQAQSIKSNGGRGGRSTEVITDAQIAFVEKYISNGFNASAAARDVGLHPHAGTTLIRNKKVRALIDKHLEDFVMTAQEVLSRLSEQARGDYAPYIDGEGNIDLEGLLADGKGHLVQEVKEGRWGTTIKFYNSQEALRMLARYYSLVGADTRVEVNQIRFETIEIRLSDNEPQPMIIEGETAK